MTLILDNPIIIEQLNNCTASLQNASNTENALYSQITSLNNTITLMGGILILITIIAIAIILYFMARKFWSYKLGFIRFNTIQWVHKWNIAEKITIKHSSKDTKTYLVDRPAIIGNTLLWVYGNERQIKINEEDLKATIKDVRYQDLEKSTIIEKFVTAEDFMGLIKILLIIVLVLIVLALILNYLTYNKETICYAIINNITLAEGVI